MSLLHELSAAVIRNRLHIGRSDTCKHKTIQIIQIYTSNLARAPFSNSPCANAHLDEVSSIPDSLPRDSSPQVKQTCKGKRVVVVVLGVLAFRLSIVRVGGCREIVEVDLVDTLVDLGCMTLDDSIVDPWSK